mgnify:CR=1 FL=1
MLLHSTCISFDKKGVLLQGPSGIGKSDLALRLIEMGGILVADDQVDLSARAGKLIANAPKPLLGKLEIRGLGIIEFPVIQNISVMILVDLIQKERVPRSPELEYLKILNVPIRRLFLSPFEVSCAIKIKTAVRRFCK